MSRSGPRSPCVSICALDEAGLCVGCLRTGDEISRWGDMTAAEKSRVLEQVAKRESRSSSLIGSEPS